MMKTEKTTIFGAQSDVSVTAKSQCRIFAEADYSVYY
jgi:hypothetical protein